jgi:hypothetical protein
MRGRKQARRQFVAMSDVDDRIPENRPIREVKQVVVVTFHYRHPPHPDRCFRLPQVDAVLGVDSAAWSPAVLEGFTSAASNMLQIATAKIPSGN